MIQSLYELGLALETRQEHARYFASYANPFAGYDGEAKVVIVDIEEDKVVDSLNQEDYRSGNAGRYLYRKPKGARGAPLVATGPLYPVQSLDSEKQQEKQRDNVAKVMSRIARSIPDGRSVYFSSTAAKEEGMVVIQQLLEGKTGSKDTRYIYTVRIDGKYLGEIESLRELLDEEAYTKYYEKSRAKGKTCALSQERNVDVWGRVDTLGFTVNDSTFSRGGFDVGDSYRMFPVSKPAVMALEAARRFAFAELSDRFYTLEYLIVPRMIEGRAEQLEEIARMMAGLRKDTALTEKAVPILKAEGLLEVLAAAENLNRLGVLYDILFYQRNQAQLALTLHLQDINPSRLQEIRDVFAATSKRYGKAFGYRNKDKTFVNFRISFGIVKNFFSEGKGLKVSFHPSFYRLLECIFYDRPFNEQTVVAALVGKICKAFKNDGDDYHLPFHTTVQHAIATWALFGRLGLFNHENYTIMKENDTPITLQHESFIEEHAAFFENQPAFEGAFLLGLATSSLTYEQSQHLGGSKPFLKKLGNLNFGLDNLMELQHELVDKLLDYLQKGPEKTTNRCERALKLVGEASALLMLQTKADRDKLSFSFATGLVLQPKFANQGKKDAEMRKAEKALPPKE